MKVAHLLILMFFSWYANGEGQLYRYTKADGTVVYTDKALPGATKVNTGRINQVSMVQPEARSKPKRKLTRPAKPAVRLRLVEPGEGAHIRSNNGDVKVVARADQPGVVQYRVLLDGEPVAQQGEATTTLTNVPRGEHRLQVIGLDARQQPLGKSAEVTFYVHRVSVLLPAR